jgi:predicted alpha/beta-hydrolase family hydrolase
VQTSYTRTLSIAVGETHRVSGLLQVPAQPKACYVLAHGAGAGMTQPFLVSVAAELGERGIATLRFQFPYMEAGAKRPDPPALAHATVRAAVDEAVRQVPDLPLIAGGRSFGGRMTSQAHAASALPGVRGIVFLGFPLHPVGNPSDERAEHLFEVNVPMLFLQGTRDTLADLELLQPVIDRLGARATLHLLQGADHAFHVPGRPGRKDPEVRHAMLDALAAWVDTVLASPL